MAGRWREVFNEVAAVAGNDAASDNGTVMARTSQGRQTRDLFHHMIDCGRVGIIWLL